jgi:acyl dehydratase
VTIYYDDVQPGQQLASLSKGPITPAHIMRWSAAVENWHRIHYDQTFAKEQDKLPDILINGSWKQHVLVQLMKDGLGPDGWLWKIQFRYKRMDVAWDTLNGSAEVVEKREADGLGFVACRIALINHRDEVSTAGTATGVLPLKGGRKVPYPFVPKPDYPVFAIAAD